MVLPGVIGYVLWQKGAFALATVPGTGTPDYNTMLPALINHLVPTGLRGLAGRLHGGGAHELHGRGPEQLCDARVHGRRQAHPARHSRRARGEYRARHDRRHHAPGHALVHPGRPVRDHLRGHQQDPDDVRSRGHDGVRPRAPVEARHLAGGHGDAVRGLAHRRRVLRPRPAEGRPSASGQPGAGGLRRARHRSRRWAWAYRSCWSARSWPSSAS